MDTQEITLSQDASKKALIGTVRPKSSKESAQSSWQLVRLGEVCEKTALVNPVAYPEKPFTYIDVSSVSNESYRIIETREILGKDAPSRARKSVQTDDIIFATVRPTLKRVAMVPSKLNGQVCSTGFCVLRANRKGLEPQYLYFLLLTESVNQRVESLQKGATYPAINDTDLFNLLIPLPPISEQNAIAHVLQRIQDAIQARRDELELERERKVALMEYLFTHGTQSEPLKQTEIGKIPENWPIVSVDDVKADFKGSLVAGPFGSNIGKRFFMNLGVPVIRGGNLTTGSRFFIDEGFVFVSEEKAEELKSCEALPNDLVFTAAGTIGQVGIIPKTCVYARYIISNKQIRLRVNEVKVLPLFMFYWFSNEVIQALIAKRKSGTSIPVINLGIIRNLPVPLPKLNEQHNIVDILQSCDNKIVALEQEQSLLEELFKALLEELMTGRLSTLPLIEEGDTHD